MRISTYMDLWPSVQLSPIADNDEEAMGILADNNNSVRERDRPGSRDGAS